MVDALDLESSSWEFESLFLYYFLHIYYVNTKQSDEKFTLSVVKGNLSSCTIAPLAKLEKAACLNRVISWFESKVEYYNDYLFTLWKDRGGLSSLDKLGNKYKSVCWHSTWRLFPFIEKSTRKQATNIFPLGFRGDRREDLGSYSRLTKIGLRWRHQ
jgi:hypothetical protein